MVEHSQGSLHLGIRREWQLLPDQNVNSLNSLKSPEKAILLINLLLLVHEIRRGYYVGKIQFI